MLSKILNFSLVVGEADDYDVEICPVVYTCFFGSLGVAGVLCCCTGSLSLFLAGSGVGEDSVGNDGHGRFFMEMIGWEGELLAFC